MDVDRQNVSLKIESFITGNVLFFCQARWDKSNESYDSIVIEWRYMFAADHNSLKDWESNVRLIFN